MRDLEISLLQAFLILPEIFASQHDREVADCNFIRRGVLNDLRAQIGAMNGALAMKAWHVIIFTGALPSASILHSCLSCFFSKEAFQFIQQNGGEHKNKIM